MASTSFPAARYLFFHPDHVRYFLKDNARNFHKSSDYYELMPVLGQGLLSSEDEPWRAQRRLIGPEFQPQAIQRYGATVVELTRCTIEDWEEAAHTAPVRDVAADMMGLALNVAGAVFFGSESAQTPVVPAGACSSRLPRRPPGCCVSSSSRCAGRRRRTGD